jgi:hypothetical protein
MTKSKIIRTNRIKNHIQYPKKSFIKFPLHFSKEEKEVISKINIDNDSTFDHYGLFEKINISDIEIFLEKIGKNNKNNCKKLTKIIIKICNDIKQNCKDDQNALWLTIRVKMPTRNFEIPRWHSDGRFYNIFTQKEIDIQWKFLTTLIGPGTRLCEPSFSIKKKLYKMKDPVDRKDQKLYIEHKQKKVKLLSKTEKFQLTNNEGAIIIAHNNLKDDIKYRTIHSEPDITEPRLFISILPGSIDEISELGTRRGFQIKK